MTEIFGEGAARLPVLFHRHPQQLGEQISQLLAEHPDVDPGKFQTLDGLGKALGGTVFNVWDMMDLTFKPPRERPPGA